MRLIFPFSSSVTLFLILSKVLKWRSLKWGLSWGNKKKSQALNIRRKGGGLNHRNAYVSQKLFNGNCRVTLGRFLMTPSSVKI
jgi:hypothetical protein